MKYRIQLNDRDYYCFNLFYATRSKSGKRSKKILLIMFSILAVVSLLLYVITNAENELYLMNAIFLVIMGCFLFTPAMTERAVEANMKRLSADGKLPYHPESEIEFQDSMIVERSEQGESHIKYEDIENIYLEEEYLFIFYSAIQAFIIPYRCLGEDKERVVEYVMKKKADILA